MKEPDFYPIARHANAIRHYYGPNQGIKIFALPDGGLIALPMIAFGRFAIHAAANDLPPSGSVA